MATISLSPAVTVVEKDISNVVPAIASTPGATAGDFSWGPVMEPVLISSENELVRVFGKPNSITGNAFFTAANFLSYASSMVVIRAATSAMKNATVAGNGVLIKNVSDYEENFANGQATGKGEFAARYAGVLGNSVGVSVCDNGGWSRTLTGTVTSNINSSTVSGINTTFSTDMTIGDLLYSSAGRFIGRVANIVSDGEIQLDTNAFVSIADENNVVARWEFFQQFSLQPGTSEYVENRSGSNDELHAIIYDSTGAITGIPGSILEKYEFLSKASDAKDFQGSTKYYPTVIAAQSEYVYWIDHPVTDANWGSPAAGVEFSSQTKPFSTVLSGGTEGGAATQGELIAAFDLLADDQTLDISLIAAGKAPSSLFTYLLNNIAEVRKDCIVFGSPQDPTTGEPILGASDASVDKLLAYRNALPSTSYGFLDSGYKYQYDKYNDVFRWVPLNGDMAGLCARTDQTADPWFSPGGFNRGQVKNVVKLGINPNKAQRDSLYSRGVNPVVSFPGQGTVLFGDKTLLAKPSAFDRINVRRLFIVLEKSIATASRFILFEQNDDFTRRQFISLVEPFLRNVRGRRGLTDFKVVCDGSNNTPQVIDNNEFRADIFLAPTKSINFITLTFVATRTGASFSEIAGA